MIGYSYTLEYRREYVEANRVRIRETARRSYATRNNAITLTDLGIVPTICPVLGIEITVFGGRDNRPEIDRLIPSLGYVPGNVAIISARANRIKNDGTLDDLVKDHTMAT